MHANFEFTIFVGDLPANGDALIKVLHKFARAAFIDECWIASEATVTRANTNYTTWLVKNETDAATIASVADGPASSAGTSLVIGVPKIFSTMTGGAVHAGDVLTLDSTHEGNGLIMYGCSVTIYGHYTD